MFGLLFLLFNQALLAQTPGQIFQGSTGYTGTSGWGYPWTPINPDGDNYIIEDGDPFLDNDGPGGNGSEPGASLISDFAVDERNPDGTSRIELTWVPIPQIDTEPNADQRLGADCGQSDIIDDPTNGAEASYVYYYNHPTEGDILIYRLRIAKDAIGSFGYSVLMDTDGRIGSDDPGSIVGNPGFEYEIRFRTQGSNPGLSVDNVDGTTSGTNIIRYALGTHDQRSYATFDGGCGGTPVFYDWWIKLSDIGATIDTGVRLAAATSQDGSSVLGNTGSDIGGVDDNTRIGGGLLFELQDDALDSLIRLQSSTPIGNLGEGGCLISGTADVPTIATPIFDSSNQLNGTSTEDEGSTINIYRNGVLFGSTRVDGAGNWRFTNKAAFTLGLRPFDEIRIEVDPLCKNPASATTVNIINDLDSDDDGIPDSKESANGIDPGGDIDGDNIPNYSDLTFPGYVDSNGDGINDLFDKDLDGIPDHFDLDSDNDGIPDLVEAGGTDTDNNGVVDNLTDTNNNGMADVIDGNPLAVPDTDSDGLPNHLDLDSDGDGIVDLVEAGGSDALGDGVIDVFLDTDADGIPDIFDIDFVAGVDTDGDGIEDTFDSDIIDNDGIPDAVDSDSDNDGIPDNVDVDQTGGTDADGDGIDDLYDATESGGVDYDGDGIQDADETTDADNDGILDFAQNGTDANGDGIDDDDDTDTDGDGILNVHDFDADGNGFYDVIEGTGLALPDTDTDGFLDYLDLDSDGDGITDNVEGRATGDTNLSTGTDSDGDGIDDAYDPDGGTPITPINTDGDSGPEVPDYQDTDSDNDGVSDLIEGNDTNRDGVNDVVPSGTDNDNDGIDDSFDTNTSSFGPVVSNVAVGDTDGDGIPDYRDTDDDGDGTDIGEPTLDTDDEVSGGALQYTQGQPNGTIPDYLFNPDYDGDGVNDIADLDSDNDGILDSDETGSTAFNPTADEDGDGIFNYLDTSDINFSGTDINGDGIVDAFDTDLDGIPDFQDRDSDNDGIVDVIEAGGTDANGDGIVDAFTDADGDGLHDPIDNVDSGSGGSEVTSGTPLPNPDTDTDGINDAYDIDSDNDGITDNIEAQSSANYIAPSGIDSDRDGIDNAYDTDALGTPIINPEDSEPSPDGTPDYLDTDSDGDGVPDIIEGHDFNRDGRGDWDTNGNGVVNGGEGTGDADGDGLLDAFDTDAGAAGAVVGDTDGDGAPDFRDNDDDGDGIITGPESGAGVLDDEDRDNDGNWANDFTDGGGAIPDYLFNPDYDGDGVNDAIDPDSDNDGIPDIQENGGVVDETGPDAGEPLSPSDDRDGDGIPNYLDLNDNNFTATDVNGDGIVDQFDTDLDGIPDFHDLDSDNDGVYDVTEAGGTDANNDGIIDGFTDADGDGLHDPIDNFDSGSGGSEVTGGTPLANPDSDGDGLANAYDVDSDNDGIPDIIENGGTDVNNDGRVDDPTDTDRDGIADIVETPLTVTNTDGDGLPNYLDLDSDADGIADIRESGGTDTNNDGVVDNNTDTDGDGLANTFDSDNGGTPLTALDFDNDGVINANDLDSDNDGILDNIEANVTGSTGGTNLIPVNTDGTGLPDYLDLDSDGDGIPDIVEGHDADTNGIADWDDDNDQIVDANETNDGNANLDEDGDGILDVFDTDNGGTVAPLQNTDAGTAGADLIPDWRDTDDDGDGIPTIDEPLDARQPRNGIPDYLESSSGDICGPGFIQNSISGNAIAVFSSDGATNPSNILGSGNGNFVQLATSNGNADVNTPADDFIIIELGHTVPKDSVINIRFSSSAANKDVFLAVSGSLTSSGFGSNTITVTDQTSFTTYPYVVTNTFGVKFLRLVFSNEESGNPELRIDNVSYAFTECDPDTDNDGIPDDVDLDDDNDGIADIIDGNGSVDPSLDADSDGVPNFRDTDIADCGGLNAQGVCNGYDFDGDGIPNHLDLDSDSDGLPDALEANNVDSLSTLPANMQADGQYPVSTVQSNDNNNNGLHNAFDPADGGDGTFGTFDNDSDGSPDFLDINSDNDVYGDTGLPAFDWIESNDGDGDLRSYEELVAKANALEAAYTAANPGMTLNYYPTDTTDMAVDANGNNVPDWLDDNDNDGFPNFMDFGQPSYRDTDGDGLVDLFDSDSYGIASVADTAYLIFSPIPTSLPLDFLEFTVSYVGGRIEIMWKTTNEEDVEYFDIERSMDGHVFVSLGTLPARNNSPAVNTYDYVDRAPNVGYNYYRITEYDFDGLSESTEIVFVLVSNDSREIEVLPYPNPVSGFLRIKTNIPLNGMAYQLMDMGGRRTLDGRVSNEGLINLSAVPAGLYVLQVNLPDRVMKFKVIKQ